MMRLMIFLTEDLAEADDSSSSSSKRNNVVLSSTVSTALTEYIGKSGRRW